MLYICPLTNMLERAITWLKQPYPDRDDLVHDIRTSVLTALIVFFVLFAFQPFNLHQTGKKVGYYALQFGLISGLVSLLFNLFLRYILRVQRDSADWTLWKWIMTVSLLILCIAIANYVYITATFNQAFDGAVLLKVIGSTFLVGIVPVSIFGGYNMSRHLHRYQSIAANLSPPSETAPENAVIQLPIHRSEKTFPIAPQDILYLEAMQNYVSVTYMADSQIKQDLIRNTLSALEKALKGSSIKRCHRSYMVNMQRIDRIEGNAQGLKLFLTPDESKVVPVSRKYIPIFRK